MMDRGVLRTWDPDLKSYEHVTHIMDENQESWGINALFCHECGHVELVLM